MSTTAEQAFYGPRPQWPAEHKPVATIGKTIKVYLIEPEQ